MAVKANDNYLKLKAGYLFPEIARRVREFQGNNPGAEIIKLGIGDITEPLPPACVEAMHKALDEQAKRETFHGYGPEQGFEFLRDKIAQHDYKDHGCSIEADEIFVSDGSKCDTGNILDILGPDNTIAVVDPVYPVYVDTNVMAGNTGPAKESGEYEGLVYLPATADNDFVAPLPDQPVDVIYLCYPNNPTGAVITKDRLKQWVDYARKHDAVILYDAAYEAYITDKSIPHSIFEVEGARECAIEFRSFSKSAGFTGTRCAFTVVPKDVKAKASDGSDVALHGLWNRRQSTKFNGVNYVVQRGAEAVYSPEGYEQIKQMINFFLENARIVRETLSDAGMTVYGGVHSPYVWIKAPEGYSSFDLFDKLLNEAHVVGTPGSGFGASGEGYFRISGFNSRENIEKAMERIGSKLAV
jgi:LL-diaminopimelate aminotransferase